MSLPTLSILVVEDHANTRAGLAMVLEGLRYRYALACDADEALCMAASMSFDVLLTDVHMPRLSGWRLVRQLKAEGALARAGGLHERERHGAGNRAKPPGRLPCAPVQTFQRRGTGRSSQLT